MNNITIQTIISVHHWTNTLFSFKCTRDYGLRFNNGQFVMVGLKVNSKKIMRAYSIVSANYEEYLEFLSIKVEHGELTSYLKKIKTGDKIFIGTKATGTLIFNNLIPGKILWLLCTGTGIAPFISIIKDLDIYNFYEKIILIHTCRFINELAYRKYITEDLCKHQYLGEKIKKNLIYYPTVTREKFKHYGRFTDMIKSKKIFEDLKISSFLLQRDRFMICGSPHMIKDTRKLLNLFSFKESKNNLGHFLIENAFIN